jgi:hypothetical protein
VGVVEGFWASAEIATSPVLSSAAIAHTTASIGFVIGKSSNSHDLLCSTWGIQPQLQAVAGLARQAVMVESRDRFAD